MMYPRLKLAKNLLSNDGVLFVSIDDNEVTNMKKLCDELFGSDNFLNMIVLENDSRARPYGVVATTHEYILVYSKSTDFAYEAQINDEKQFKYSDEKGGFDLYELRNRNVAFNSSNRPNLYYPFWVNPSKKDKNGLFEISLSEQEGYTKVYPQESQGIKTVWRWGKDRANNNLNTVLFARKVKSKNRFQVVKKYREKTFTLNTVWTDKAIKTDKGTLEVKAIFDNKKFFDFPKPVELIRRLLQISMSQDEDEQIVLDFFSGSATTAHSVMTLNSQDNGNRKFIMVQLPEITDQHSEAYKNGYLNICDIAKERLKRAGKMVVQQSGETDLDIGFRVLKIDTSNMADLYYSPSKLKQANLQSASYNIKPDRDNPEDLLFQVLVDWGVDLTLPIRSETIQGKTVFFVNREPYDLIACFDSGVTETLVKELAKYKPERVVFKDMGFASDAVKINVEQIFRQLSPTTEVRSI